jgi:small subunit ribosomal protein S1
MTPPDDQEEDFATLLAEYDHQRASPARREPRVGETVKGPVIAIGAESVFIDLGAKSEGILDLAEMLDEHGRPTVNVGDELEARVVQTGAAGIVLRRVLGRGAEANAALEQAYAHRIPVEGLVTAVNKGGVEVQVGSARGFCPVSQLDAKRVDDPATFVGLDRAAATSTWSCRVASCSRRSNASAPRKRAPRSRRERSSRGP